LTQIDLIITELDVGGAERTLVRLATQLQKHGDEVRVFSLGRLPRCHTPGDGRDSLVSELQAHGIDLTSGGGSNIWALPAVYRNLRRWLNRRPVAVRQSFLFHANVLTAYAGVRSCYRNAPWIAGVRVADPNRPRIWLEGRAMRRADHVVCVSSAVESFARQCYSLTDSQTSVIGNAVEIERFANATPFDWPSIGWAVNTPVVLFVGRLHEQKNLGLLKHSLDQFIPAGSDRKLVLVGDGPQRAELTAWANSVTGDRVRVLPWQADVAPLLAASRVLVLPSHYEGMPNVVLEAMAAGKPVVCSRVEGSRELIGNDPAQGFDSNNAEQLAARLNRFLEDPDFASQIGRINQQRMQTDFSVQRMVNAYRELYRSLE
jgi:starch synthase (maltosyl-transferring)